MGQREYEQIIRTEGIYMNKKSYEEVEMLLKQWGDHRQGKR